MAAAGYFAVTVLQVPSLLFEEPGEPRNLLIVNADQSLSDALDAMQFVAALVVVAAERRDPHPARAGRLARRSAAR